MAADDNPHAGWRKNWLSSIREFADLDEQSRTWLNRENTNPHFSFVECNACYFDDLRLCDSGSYADFVANKAVTLAEAEAVREFHAAADAYESPRGDNYDHDAILRDPNWLAVVAAARQAIDRLLLIIQDPAEHEILLEKTSVEALLAGRTVGLS